jgi:hypothetical protein
MNALSFSRTLALTALLGASVAQASLITNGGFEAQPDPVAGWTLGGNPSLVFFDGVAPHSGLVGASFGSAPADPAWIEQTVATEAGRSYELRFWLQNGADAIAGQPNRFALNLDGGAAELELLDAAAFGYREFLYTFSANSAATLVRFDFANFAGYWDFDDVSLQAVPAPSALALALCALAASGTVRRRR